MAAGPGRRPIRNPEDRTAGDGGRRAPHLLPVGVEFAEFDGQDFHRFFPGGHHLEDLGNSEEAGGDRDEADAPLGGFDAEGEALQTADRIHSHGGKDQAGHHHDQGAGLGFSGQVGQEDDSQDRQGEVFGRPEGEGGSRQEGGEELQGDHAEGSGNERADRGDGQRRPGPSLFRHRVTVEGGHDAGRLSRDIDQDRGRRAPVHGPVIDPRQHDQTGGGTELQGQGDDQGHGRRRAETRQHPDQRADQRADKAGDHVVGLKRDQQIG